MWDMEDLSDAPQLSSLARRMLFLIAATAFCAEYLLFYFHSTTHKGLDEYFYLLLVLLIALCILSTVAGAPIPNQLRCRFV